MIKWMVLGMPMVGSGDPVTEKRISVGNECLESLDRQASKCYGNKKVHRQRKGCEIGKHQFKASH